MKCGKPYCVCVGECFAASSPLPDEAADYLDDEGYFDDPVCERCGGDGRDPWNDYLLPCPLCLGDRL